MATENFTPIEATEPTRVPATAEKVFNKWWIKNMQIMAVNPNRPVKVIVNLAQYMVKDDESIELNEEKTARVKIDDLFADAEGDAELAALIGKIFEKVKAIGVAQGVL